MPAASASKAVKLLAEGRVMPAGAAAVFRVQGDHDTYDVVIGDGFEMCSCPAHGDCSHRTAARLIQAALVDGVAAAVKRRDFARPS